MKIFIDHKFVYLSVGWVFLSLHTISFSCFCSLKCSSSSCQISEQSELSAILTLLRCIFTMSSHSLLSSTDYFFFFLILDLHGEPAIGCLNELSWPWHFPAHGDLPSFLSICISILCFLSHILFSPLLFPLLANLLCFFNFNVFKCIFPLEINYCVPLL